jgi:heme exporter protein D
MKNKKISHCQTIVEVLNLYNWHTYSRPLTFLAWHNHFFYYVCFYFWLGWSMFVLLWYHPVRTVPKILSENRRQRRQNRYISCILISVKKIFPNTKFDYIIQCFISTTYTQYRVKGYKLKKKWMDQTHTQTTIIIHKQQLSYTNNNYHTQTTIIIHKQTKRLFHNITNVIKCPLASVPKTV